MHDDHHHRHAPEDAINRHDRDGRHDHVFLGAGHERNERRTWAVIAITTVMMIVEIIAGSLYGSMALLADGFHMSTHAGALLIAALAYLYARRHAGDRRFTFGTGKIGDLAAFSSAIVLALVAVIIGYESLLRLYAPVEIRFGEAVFVAVIGLIVNLVCAVLLHQGDHGHAHDDDHGHEHHDHGHHDHDDRNLKAAYLHVLADALTSVLAIVGLLAGWFFGWIWVDALVGILGSVVIARWSIGLMKGAGAVLLDTVPDDRVADAIRETIEERGDRITDLHLWRVGPGHMAAVVALASSSPESPATYKQRLARVAGLSHVSIEVNATA